MSIFSGFGGKKGNYTLAATVDEHSLVFVLLRNTPSGPQVERHGIHYSATFPGTYVLDELLSQLRNTFPIRQLVVSFAAPYFEIQSMEQSIARVSPTQEITRGEAYRIASKMIELAERRLRRQIFEESGILPNDFVIQKANIFHWKIDGYAVDKLEGYKGEEVEGLVLGSFLREDYADFVAKLQKKHTLAVVSLVHPFEGAQQTGISGIFVHFTEEKTQVLAQNKEMFALTKSFSPGASRFRDVFSEEFGMVENIAREFEENYIKGSLSEEVRAKIHSFLLPEIYNFGTIIQEELGGIKISTPPQVYLFGHGIRFPEVLQLFAFKDSKNLPFQGKPHVEILFPTGANTHIDAPKNFDARYTPVFFLTEFAYANAKEAHRYFSTQKI